LGHTDDLAISVHRTVRFDVDAVDCCVLNKKHLAIIYEDRIALILISVFFASSQTLAPVKLTQPKDSEYNHVINMIQSVINSDIEFSSSTSKLA